MTLFLLLLHAVEESSPSARQELTGETNIDIEAWEDVCRGGDESSHLLGGRSKATSGRLLVM